MTTLSITIGLDLGTTRCKASAFDLKGNVLANANLNVATYHPQPGWHEQDPKDWIYAIDSVLYQIVKELGNKAKNIHCIGVSAHGPSLLPVNGDFHPLSRAIIWQDARGFSYGKKLIEKAGTKWVGVGLPMSSIPTKLAWMLDEMPNIASKATYFLSTKSFIISYLTGNAIDEPSSSSVSESWDENVFNYLGISIDRMPKIVSSETVVGLIRTELSKSLGVPPNTKVVIGLNDGASACLGAGILEDGESSISLGTNAVVRFTLSQKLSSEFLVLNSMFCYPYINGKFILGGYTKSGGDSVDWLMSILTNNPNHHTFNHETFCLESNLSPPGSRGVVFIPYISGRGTPNESNLPNGAFFGLGRHHSRSDIIRSVLEGVAFSLREIIMFLDVEGLNRSELRIMGGGANNAIWRKIIANVLRSSLQYCQQDSALGAAIIAAVNTGLYSSYNESIRAMVKKTELEKYESGIAKEYDKRFVNFKSYANMVGMPDENN